MKMSRFNAVPIIIQQMVESIESKSTPDNVKFNQVQVLETIRDYCEQTASTWRKDQDRQTFKKRR
jgi:hypothetical protein